MGEDIGLHSAIPLCLCIVLQVTCWLWQPFRSSGSGIHCLGFVRCYRQILRLTWHCHCGFAELFRSANGGAWGLSVVAWKDGFLEIIIWIGKLSENFFFNLCRVGSQIVSLYLWSWVSLSWWSGTGRKWLACMRSTTPARENSQSLITALDRKSARSLPFQACSVSRSHTAEVATRCSSLLGADASGIV